jgi:hypothetical protein
VLPDLAKETDGAPQFARMTADPFLDPQTREAIDFPAHMIDRTIKGVQRLTASQQA